MRGTDTAGKLHAKKRKRKRVTKEISRDSEVRFAVLVVNHQNHYIKPSFFRPRVVAPDAALAVRLRAGAWSVKKPPVLIRIAFEAMNYRPPK